MNAIKISFLFLLIISLSACTNPSVKINLLAAPYLNPSAQKKSLPVQVRIYELNDIDTFAHASFRELWKHDTSILGEQLLASKTLMLSPDSHAVIRLQRAKNARFIGVIAIFRKPKHDKWRVMHQLPEPVAALFSSITIRLRNNTISVSD